MCSANPGRWISRRRSGAVRRSYDSSAPPDKSQPWMSGDLTITSLSLDLYKVLSSTYWGGKALDFITSSTGRPLSDRERIG